MSFYNSNNNNNEEEEEDQQQIINENFHEAVASNDIAKVKEYLSMGADIECENSSGSRAVHTATLKGFNKLVEILIQDYGADVNAKENKFQLTSLHIACILSNFEMIQLLCNHSNIDLDAVDNFGVGALSMTCRNRKNIEIVYFLIGRGCNLNLRNNLGQSALDIARQHSSHTIIDILMSHQELHLQLEKMMTIN